MSDDLARLPALLRAHGVAVAVHDEIGSTNDEAAAWASGRDRSAAPDFATVVAESQTKGRGRHGRAWSTAPGASIAMSIVVRPDVPPAMLPPLAIVAGLAVREAIASRVSDREVRIKWPNDVVVRAAGGDGVGKKIAGVLVEGAIAGMRVEHAIVGVGINVAQLAMDEAIASKATSLAIEGAAGASLDRAALIVDVVVALRRGIATWVASPSSIGDRLAPFDALVGVAMQLDDGAACVGAGVEPDGRLRVERADATIARVHAGEASVLGWR